jgi:hypothetical protein
MLLRLLLASRLQVRQQQQQQEEEAAPLLVVWVVGQAGVASARQMLQTWACTLQLGHCGPWQRGHCASILLLHCRPAAPPAAAVAAARVV